LTKTVLETASTEAMTEHFGYAKHEADGAGSGNVRNGTRSKTVLTDATGQVQIDVPRDRVRPTSITRAMLHRRTALGAVVAAAVWISRFETRIPPANLWAGLPVR
jgi:transposase-like protein